MREDASISETCPLEESASHHFIGYQEWPGMQFEITRCHETQLQRVEIRKFKKKMSESVTPANISGQIQNLRWTQLESTSKIMRVRIENSSFEYDLTI